MSRRKPCFARLAQCVALLATLVVAQAVVLTHDETQESHPPNDVCAICVGLASLGSGNVSAPPPALSPAQPEHRYDNYLVPARSFRAPTQLARGPPAAS